VYEVRQVLDAPPVSLDPPTHQYQAAINLLDAAVKKIVLGDRPDKLFEAGGQVKVHYPRKARVAPSSVKDDSWTIATGTATAVGIGRLSSLVGGEPT